MVGITPFARTNSPWEQSWRFKFSLETYRESSHWNNVGSASNMIPCFPASNGTDAHHCDTISNRSSPSHFAKDSPSNISQVRTRSTTKKLRHCLENHKGYHLRNDDEEECSCCSFYIWWLIGFRNMFIYVRT